MPTVRLSGKVTGAKDPNREARGRMLYLLFAAGWDIYNANGDQRISLSNIEKKIKESDAFVFMPGASLDDLFKAISIFVGYQTLDKDLARKATVILNGDKSWDPLFNLLDELRILGTIKQNHRDYLLEVPSPEEVLVALERVQREGLPDVGREKISGRATTSYESEPPPGLEGNVCVFCSASLEDPTYLQDGYNFGEMLAQNNYGCVSGAGTTGIMGEVVRGSVEAGGWTGGSNVPHIIELEGLPLGLSSFWLRPDIYTRMEVMIENSDAFVIFPGGAGTVQEVLALLIFKEMRSSLLKNKPIVLYNRRVPGTEIGFWDKLIKLLEPWEEWGYFEVADTLEGLLDTISSSRAQSEKKQSSG